MDSNTNSSNYHCRIGSSDSKTKAKFKNKELDAYRNQEIGFIFQDYKLLNEMTISENILIPQVLDHVQKEQAEHRMKKIVKLFDIDDKLKFYPYELSGGEKQRVSICRALMNNPKVILADEPTGNLDSNNTERVLEILIKLKEDYGKTIILVTHDINICKYADRVIYI